MMSVRHVEGVIMAVHATKVLLLVVQVSECVTDMLIGFNVLLDVAVISFQQRILVHLRGHG